MRRILLLFLFICMKHVALSQQLYLPCKDSSKVDNPGYYCYDDFYPVCACDGNEYRNPCVAENQHAINSHNFTEGPCGNYAFDISPNQITDYIDLKIKKIKSGYFVVTIYNVFGTRFYSQAFTYSDASANYLEYQLPASSLDQGLYLFEVISDNEQQVKKIFKVELN